MKQTWIVAGVCLLLSGPAMARWGKKDPGAGAAAGSNASHASATLERCDKPMGTLAMVEDQGGDWYRYLTYDLRLPSTIPLMRMLVQ